MKAEKSPNAPARQWPLAVALLGIILLVLFFKSMVPGYVHFSNDGPLGQQNTAWVQFPQAFTGMWDDMNVFGYGTGAAAPGPSEFLRWALGPVGYSKCYAPVALFLLGVGAWAFFNQLRLARGAALLGALLVTLNSTMLSTACWGVASQQIGIGFDLMALALVVSLNPTLPPWIRWTRIMLAGLAVGVNVMEAADIGALLSLFVAAFVMYHAWVATEGATAAKLSRGIGRVALIALSALFIAAFAVSSLIGTQIKGVSGTKQDDQSKQAHWDWATQWSFPKTETLGLIVPGLYGYRMDTPDGGNYWGKMGRDPAWYRYFESGKTTPVPPGFLRFSGGGSYLGVTVVLLAFWAAFQSFRKNSVFNGVEKKLIWFWAASLAVSLLLAYGRFAPFYQFLYALPYFSTIRNPAKFIILFTLATTVLAAYGVHGLYRGWLDVPLQKFPGLGARLKSWWAKASVFDRRWTLGCLVAIALSLVGWLIYAASQHALEAYLQEVQFSEQDAPVIAAFSIRQVGWYLLFLSLGAGLITLILSGMFAGRKARQGLILLGLLIVADLGRADLPWIKYVDYKEKYEIGTLNPIVQFLAQQPWEHRVAILPFKAPPQYGLFDQIYRIEWAQHHFQYYNVQSLDIVQMPRTPEDLLAFEMAMQGDGTPNTMYKLCRRWELTNTRYLLGPAGFLDVLNEQLDPVQRRFRIVRSFDILAKPGVSVPTRYEEMTAVLNNNGAGQYALFEFTGALPRAGLYSNWQINTPAALKAFTTNGLNAIEMQNLAATGTNDFITLQTMAAKSFDPWRRVLVADGVPAPDAAGTNATVAAAQYLSYTPKDIRLKARTTRPSVLLLNDKYDPSWQVTVDGRPAALLRCNFLMRGVYLPTAGDHVVEFVFKPDVGMLYVSLAGIGLGVLLIGVVAFEAKSRRSKPATP